MLRVMRTRCNLWARSKVVDQQARRSEGVRRERRRRGCRGSCRRQRAAASRRRDRCAFAGRGRKHGRGPRRRRGGASWGQTFCCKSIWKRGGILLKNDKSGEGDACTQTGGPRAAATAWGLPIHCHASSPRGSASGRRMSGGGKLPVVAFVYCDNAANVTEKSFKQERQETHLAVGSSWLPDLWTFVHFFSLLD
jgi:hypothetical protein